MHDKHDPKVGPMNDGYLVGLNHHRLGFKVFYLNNCESNKYQEFLQFFLKHTLHQLTVFYSGRDTITHSIHGIEFKDRCISCSDFGKLISENYNSKCKIVFISDSTSGGSVFGIQFFSDNSITSNIISFSVAKCTDPNSKEGRRSHGLFTYFLCKIIYECPNITPKKLSERINPSLKRFNETMICEYSNNELENQSFFQ